MQRRRLIQSGAGLAGVLLSGMAGPLMAHDADQQEGNDQPGEFTVRKGYIDGSSGQLHYYRASPKEAGAPALALLHQSPLSGRQFEQVLPRLGAMGIDAIALDTPGYGNSDVPPAPPSIADYANAVRELLDGLALRTAHILGHHTGAQAATAFAKDHPSRVSSIILNSPPFFSDEDLERLAEFEHAPNEYSRDGSHLMALFQRRAKYSPGWTDEEVMHRRLVDQLWAGETVWYGHHAAFTYDIRPDLAALSVSGLILTNTGDGIYDLAQIARAARPDFAYRELDGGTHDIVDEQPDAWSEIVASWVLKGSAE